MSNRFVLVDREFIHPFIDGVDFGGKVWCIVRSPAAVLIWVFGHSWTVNGHQSYAEAVMYLLPDRAFSGNLKYERLIEGGRLSGMRIAAPKVLERLHAVFGSDAIQHIMHAAAPYGRAPKRTLLIEGGGPKLMPSRRGGEAEYRAWRDLPYEDRGFRLPAAQEARDRRSFGYGYTRP